jgi:hypothetical protein
VIDALVKQQKRQSITWGQVISFTKDKLQQFIVFLPIFLMVGGAIWKVYAEPLIEEKIKEELAPLADIQKTLKQMRFDQKKMQLIQERTIDKKVLQEVNEDAEFFRFSD